MSDEERKMHAKENDEDAGGDDVDAHVKSTRANDEGDDDSGDDVEAHVRSGR